MMIVGDDNTSIGKVTSYAHVSSFILMCASIAAAVVDPCYGAEKDKRMMKNSTCNPIAILEQFTAEYFPNYDKKDKSISIEDSGDNWKITYYTPFEKRKADSMFQFGSDFPILVVDKNKCKLIDALIEQ